MSPASKKTQQIGVNIPKVAMPMWNKWRRGYRPTHAVIAAMGVWSTVDSTRQDRLMMLVEAACKGGAAEWAEVVEWAEEERRRLFALEKAAAKAQLAGALGKRQGRRTKPA